MLVDNCVKCKRQTCIKTGKICEKIERLLRKEGIYSADYIRPRMPSHKRGQGAWREIPFSMLDKHNIGFDNSNILNDL